MKIILDDRRPFPEKGPYNCVRTYGECVELIRLFRHISYLSLDYNLGSVKTGLDVLVYMHENGYTVKHINIHSNHILGVPRMAEYARKYFPDAELTQNPIL